MSRHDVVVIGAGAAGLACAHKLRANGLDVVVLEARERLGGRIHTWISPTGEQVEVGAQVVHGEYAFTWNVIRARGLVTEPLDVDGDFVFAVDGQRLTGAGLPRGVIAPWVVETLLTRHTGTAARLCAGTSGLTRTLALEWLAQVWAADPDDLSADGMAAVRRDRRSGRQDFLLVDGYRRVPEVLAAGLDVRLGKPVHHVAWSPAGVQVDDLEARAAVITSPPQATSRGIVFDPPLPAEKRKAVRELTFGPATVAVVSLTEPAPESAWCLTLGRTGGFLRTTRERKTLTLCCKGSTTRRLPPGEWDADLVGELAGPVLPWLRGSAIADLRVVDWTADPWALGAFGYPRDGWLDASAAWANPVGKTLFLAGDSTCGSAHPSSVHGALESGVRASAEVLEGVGHVR